MALDINILNSLEGSIAGDTLHILLPYLPALAREGEEVYEGFVAHFLNKDWAAIDELMYEKMTPAERAALENQVYQDAREAAQARYDNIKLTKEIILKASLAILTKLITL